MSAGERVREKEYHKDYTEEKKKERHKGVSFFILNMYIQVLIDSFIFFMC